MIILYSMCLFVVANFWCLTAGFANPDTFTTFNCWGLCLTIIGRFFTQGRGGGGGGGGDLSLLVDTRHIFFVSCNRATLLDVVPFIEPT